MLSQCELAEDWWSDLLGCVELVFKLNSLGQHGSEPCTVGVWARSVNCL